MADTAEDVIWKSAKGTQDHYLELLESGTLSDAEVRCGERTWKVHKAILCVRSVWFRKALAGPFKEAETGIINITQFKENEVDCLLRYIYTGTINVSQSFPEMFDPVRSILIWKLGDFFLLEDLCKIALDESEPALRRASFAFSASPSTADLKESSMSYVANLVHALYEPESCDARKAFGSNFLAFLMSGIHALSNTAGFKDLLRDVPEFALDWAVTLTDSAASVQMPYYFSSKCDKCKKTVTAYVNRLKWAKEQRVEYLCRGCLPLQRLEDWVGESCKNSRST